MTGIAQDPPDHGLQVPRLLGDEGIKRRRRLCFGMNHATPERRHHLRRRGTQTCDEALADSDPVRAERKASSRSSCRSGAQTRPACQATAFRCDDKAVAASARPHATRTTGRRRQRHAAVPRPRSEVKNVALLQGFARPFTRRAKMRILAEYFLHAATALPSRSFVLAGETVLERLLCRRESQSPTRVEAVSVVVPFARHRRKAARKRAARDSGLVESAGIFGVRGASDRGLDGRRR